MTGKTDERVFLDGYIDVPADRLADVSAALPTHISLTRAEAGCISFSVIPSEEVDGRFMVSEVFADQASFGAHQERTRSSEWFRVTEGMPRDYTIRRGSEIGTTQTPV